MAFSPLLLLVVTTIEIGYLQVRQSLDILRRSGWTPRGRTFSLLHFWRENEEGKGIDSFAYVLRAVLANSPNSISPEAERVFSFLNDTFDDDQGSSYADYIELSLQLQFNERSRRA